MRQLFRVWSIPLMMCLLNFATLAQDTWQTSVSSDYEGLAAKYAVLKTAADESIAVRYKNNTANTCHVVLTINRRTGQGEQKAFTIKPFATLFENIGDVSSFFVSTILYSDAEAAPANQLTKSARQREKITKNKGLISAQKISVTDVQTISASASDVEDKGSLKTEIDYLGVKGLYRKWKNGKDKDGMYFTFTNTRTDLEAIVSITAKGNVLYKQSIMPGNAFSGNVKESAINIEVNFKSINGKGVDPDTSEMIFQKIKNMIRDEVKSKDEGVESLMQLPCMCVRG